MLITLQNHHKSKFMGHEVVSHYFVTIFAFSASCIRLQFFLLNSLVDIVIVDSYGLDIDLLLLL